MKTKSKQVIIIGAGGSYPYNFPLGEELLNNVQNSYVESARTYVYNTYRTSDYESNSITVEAKKFVSKLNNITGISLDKFINFNPLEKKNGLKALIIEIIKNENSSISPGSKDVKGDWYKYLFTKMISGLDSFEAVKENFHNNLSFITFNYDRSLENYLYNNLLRIFINNNVNPKDIVQIIESIPIVHVYGKTGYLDWESNPDKEKVVPYGQFDYHLFKKVESITDMIQLIYDERKASDQISKAKFLLTQSERILFCGFGYDEANLHILGLPEIITNQLVYGTGYKNTKNEMIHISNLLSRGYNTDNIHILDLDCLTLLREHLLV